LLSYLAVDQPVLTGIAHGLTRDFTQGSTGSEEQAQVTIGVMMNKCPVLIIKGVALLMGHPGDERFYVRSDKWA
jgi:hypothetical protein